MKSILISMLLFVLAIGELVACDTEVLDCIYVLSIQVTDGDNFVLCNRCQEDVTLSGMTIIMDDTNTEELAETTIPGLTCQTFFEGVDFDFGFSNGAGETFTLTCPDGAFISVDIPPNPENGIYNLPGAQVPIACSANDFLNLEITGVFVDGGDDFVVVCNSSSDDIRLGGASVFDSDGPDNSEILIDQIVPGGGCLTLLREEAFTFGLGGQDSFTIDCGGTSLSQSWDTDDDQVSFLAEGCDPSLAEVIYILEVVGEDPFEGPDNVTICNNSRRLVSLDGATISDDSGDFPDDGTELFALTIAPYDCITLTRGIHFDFGISDNDDDFIIYCGNTEYDAVPLQGGNFRSTDVVRPVGNQCVCSGSDAIKESVTLGEDLVDDLPIQDLFGSLLNFNANLQEANLPFQINATQDNATGAFGLQVLSGESGIVASPEAAAYSLYSDIPIQDVVFDLFGIDNFDQIEIVAFNQGTLLPSTAISVSTLNQTIQLNGNTIAGIETNVNQSVDLSASVFIEQEVDSIVLIAGKATGINSSVVEFQISNLCFCPGSQCFTGEPDVDLCEFIIANPDTALAQQDCDGGGRNNLFECQNEGNPLNPSDDPFIFACEELVCNGDLQISLGVSCEYELQFDDLLEDADDDNYHIEVFTEDGEFLRDDFLLMEDVGTIVQYRITCGVNSCWGFITVEANTFPTFEFPCGIQEDGFIPTGCRILCEINDPVIGDFVTVDEVREMFTNGCGPQLIGDIKVEERIIGDICDEFGRIVEVGYSFKVLLHGRIQQVELPVQRITTLPLSVDDDTIFFPDDVSLNCNYLDDLEAPDDAPDDFFELGSPSSIAEVTGIQQTAYISYEDILDTILVLVEVLDTSLVVVDKIPRDTMVIEEIDGREVWVLKTILIPVFEEQILSTIDTIGITNPIFPITEAACNILVENTDVVFPTCGGVRILRTWSAIDWCNQEFNPGQIQVIDIQDNSAPRAVEIVDGEQVIIDQLDDVIVSIEPFSCQASYKLPTLDLIDDCSLTDAFVEWEITNGTIDGDYVTGINLNNDPSRVTGNIMDECGNVSTVTFNIIIIDNVPPVVSCKSSLAVTLTGNSLGIGSIVYATNLDEGSHDNGCGKVSISVIRMDDQEEIVRDCEGNVIGYLPMGCTAFTSEVDVQPSSDKSDCEEKTISVSSFGEYVTFCCEDVGQIVPIILRVTDTKGNFSDCIVDVIVNNVNSSNTSIDCSDIIISHEDIGTEIRPSLSSSVICETESSIIEQLRLSLSIGSLSCPGDTQINQWYVDANGNENFDQGETACDQRVTIDEDLLFEPTSIHWPAHRDGSLYIGVNLECDEDGNLVQTDHTVNMYDALRCNAENVADVEPYWCELDCGLIGISVEYDTIQASDACRKILKRWTVVDWCVYENNSDDPDRDNDSFVAVEDWAINDCIDCVVKDVEPIYFEYESVDIDGYYTFDQVIKVIDDGLPTINAEEEYKVLIASSAGDKETNGANCSGSEFLSVIGSDLCGGAPTNADDLQWTITILADGAVIHRVSTRGSTISFDSQEGTVGDVHEVIFELADGCGNSTSTRSTIRFVDELAPTPVCVAGVTTAFYRATGLLEVWAQDFDFGSFDNCTSLDELRFSIVRSGEEASAPNADGFDDQQFIEFDCRADNDFQELDIYVWDTDGNGDFCTVGLVIENNVECEEEVGSSLALISGSVKTIRNEIIPNVRVDLNSNASSEFPVAVDAGTLGEYSFTNIPLNADYEINAEKEDDHLNGVSTLDIVMISRHIIGESEFDNQYDILASDVNRDQRVTASDLLSIRSLVLGVTEVFMTEQSWLFIDKNQQFFDITNPWPFTEGIVIRNLSNTMIDQDMMGIKMGDVTGDVNLIETENRSLDIVPLTIENQQFNKGEEVSIAIRSKDELVLFGTQFELSFSDMEVLDVESGALNIVETDYRLFDEGLAFSWSSPQFVSAQRDETLFTIILKAKEKGAVKDALKLNYSDVKPEIYINEEIEIAEPQLIIKETEYTDGMVLLQNYPNPFNEQTTIEFDIQSTDNELTSLKIYDSAGKLVYTQSDYFTKGKHIISIDAELLGQSGSYFYQLERKGANLSRQMMFSGR